MFAYCGNNLVTRQDPTGQSFLLDINKEVRAACWRIVSYGLNVAGYILTGQLLSQTAGGEDRNFTEGPGSYASEKCKNDSGIQAAVIGKIVDSELDASGSIHTSVPYEIPLSNGDLGAALHNVIIYIDGALDGNNLRVIISIGDTKLRAEGY